MPKIVHKKMRGIERVFDANFNRAKEGLRVCEDVARFIIDDTILAAGFKSVRHQLTGVMGSLALKNILLERDVAGDVGRSTTSSESKRGDVADVFYANIQRVKESLRVLEEFAKLVDATSAEKFKGLRYKVYGFEKKAVTVL